VYYIDWKNIQLALLDQSGPNQSGFQYTDNAGRAKSQGVELSVDSRPLAGLTVGGWIAWNEAELSEDFPANSTIYGLSGDRMPNSARFSGSVSLTQHFPLPNDMQGFVEGDVSYVGDRKGVFRATPDRQTLPSYTKADLRVGLEFADWVGSLFVNNVTDKRGVLQGGLGTTNPLAFQFIQPRTMGVFVTRSF
jgi:outer membrane receptor protein involved in Fe transport